MLSQRTIAEISRLLTDTQLSHRKIAARLGVSRGSVDLIANKRRGLHGCCEDEPAEQLAPAVRCPTCGGRVYLPCVACQVRGYRRRSQIDFRPPGLQSQNNGRRGVSSTFRLRVAAGTTSASKVA